MRVLYGVPGSSPVRRRRRKVWGVAFSCLLLILHLTSCDLSHLSGDPVAVGPEEGDLKILFIGNSLTFWWDMPGHLELLMESGGCPVWVTDASQPSTTLDEHLDIQVSIEAVGREDWDVVILQDSRYEIVMPDQRYVVIEDFRSWRDLIRTEHPEARIMMFLDYPLDTTYTVDGVTYEHWEFMDLLRASTIIVADSLGLEIAPVGWAWERVMVERPEWDLFDTDGVHPSRLGQYLQACVYYAALRGMSPYGVSYRWVLTGAAAVYIQQLAGEVVLDEPSAWNLPVAVPR